LSESKYGFSAEGSTLRVSLLRAPTAPDAECDQGHHAFSLGLLPHRGSFHESNVPAASIHFNNPLRLRQRLSASPFEKTESLFKVVGDKNIFLETIKRGEDDDHSKLEGKSVILRVYEAYGGHGRTKIIT
jgi:alpha-mannosidase